MQMFYFKFQQNHNINEEFDFFEWRVGTGEGQGDPHIKILITIGKHMKILGFKFEQNRTIGG